MANRPDTGVTVEKPTKQRRFPWRLWLYAIVFTGLAGAGGYYAWQFRGKAKDATEDGALCGKNLAKLQAAAGSGAKESTECKTALGAATIKTKEIENQLVDLSKNLNASKDELAALRAQKADADKRMAAIEDIRKQFAKMVDTGTLSVAARRGQLVLSLPSEVLFTSGSADLSKQGEIAVLEVGFNLKKLPERRFLVIGHTDNQPLVKPKGDAGVGAAFKDNWELSAARALTVVRVLVTSGMASNSLMPAGAGDHDPITSNATADGRQKNRRIEIALLPAINELPALPASLTGDTPPAATGSAAPPP